MKKYNLCVKTALAVFAVALSACSSDNDIVDNNSNNQEKPVSGKTMTFHASMDGDNATRTDFSSNSTVWTTGDAISILNKATVSNEPNRPDYAEFEITGGIGTKQADFEGGPIKANGNDGDDFYAFYPSSSFDPEGEKMIGNIPTVQTAMADTYDQTLHFMTAHSANSTFQFKNVCALLKIKIKSKGSNYSVSRIKVVANPTLDNVYDQQFNYTSIAGAFEATVGSNGIATATSTEDKKTYVELRAADDDVTLSTELSDGTYYMVVLPATLKNGFTLLLERPNGTIYQRVNPNEMSFERNRIYDLGEYDLSSSIPSTLDSYSYMYAVDLDLPSGTIWCKRNITKTGGFAGSETAYGDYFSWGKTEVTGTYSAPSTTDQTLRTADDVAYAKSANHKYCMPIYAQIYELWNGTYTSKTSSTANTPYGARFRVATGKSIFLPYGGHYYRATTVGIQGLQGKGEHAAYWSRTYNGSGGVSSYIDAHCLDIKESNGLPVIDDHSGINGGHEWGDDRQCGRNIRPVVTNVKIAPIFE